MTNNSYLPPENLPRHQQIREFGDIKNMVHKFVDYKLVYQSKIRL